MITPDKLMLIDMLIERVMKLVDSIAEVKAMNGEEVSNALADENKRTELLKHLLEETF